MPNSLTRLARLFDRSFARELRSRRDHHRGLLDPRVANEHRIADARSRDMGGDRCRFCP
jgi:hypothetical protein